LYAAVVGHGGASGYLLWCRPYMASQPGWNETLPFDAQLFVIPLTSFIQYYRRYF
jgi:hypothetical protein